MTFYFSLFVMTNLSSIAFLAEDVLLVLLLSDLCPSCVCLVFVLCLTCAHLLSNWCLTCVHLLSNLGLSCVLLRCFLEVLYIWVWDSVSVSYISDCARHKCVGIKFWFWIFFFGCQCFIINKEKGHLKFELITCFVVV